MIILVNKNLLYKGFQGMVLWPFLILRTKEMKQDQQLLNHERIHFRQQIEMLVLPFYLWYGLEFLLRLLQYKNRHTAYKNISFEQEAYACEKNVDYLKSRTFWAFTKYF